MEKPTWWPENPYPEDVFPMHVDRYLEIVPDPRARTALSGCLGRSFWNIASRSIWDAMKEADVLQACNAHDNLVAKVRDVVNRWHLNDAADFVKYMKQLEETLVEIDNAEGK